MADSRETRVLTALVLAGSLATPGCFFKRGPKVFTPPPIAAQNPTLTAPPENLPGPPDVDASTNAGIAPVVSDGTTLPPAPPKPAPPKATAPKQVERPAVVTVEPVPPPVVNPPKPASIFSAEERRRMNQDIDDSLGRVRRALARVEGKTVTAEVTALVNNARASMLQAEQARIQDLATAVNLAKRAELFATDLVQRLP
jgi:hypothetical protein